MLCGSALALVGHARWCESEEDRLVRAAAALHRAESAYRNVYGRYFGADDLTVPEWTETILAVFEGLADEPPLLVSSRDGSRWAAAVRTRDNEYLLAGGPVPTLYRLPAGTRLPDEGQRLFEAAAEDWQTIPIPAGVLSANGLWILSECTGPVDPAASAL
jgi:hypothetical protein